MLYEIDRYKKEDISKEKILEIFQGWNAYAKWANSFKLRIKIVKNIYSQNPFNLTILSPNNF